MKFFAFALFIISITNQAKEIDLKLSLTAHTSEMPEEKIIASPQVTTVLGQKATITQESKDKTEFLEIAILPTKIVEKI